MNQEEQIDPMVGLIAKCWADEAFKNRLLADPAATLKAEGIEVPEHLTVKAVENTEKVFHLVIPARPAELSDEELDGIAGGGKIWDRFRDTFRTVGTGGWGGAVGILRSPY